MKRLLSYLTLLVLLGFLGLSDAMAQLAAPTTGARFVSFSSISPTTATISWINGSGNGRMVLLRQEAVLTGAVDNPVVPTDVVTTPSNGLIANYVADNDFATTNTLFTGSAIVNAEVAPNKTVVSLPNHALANTHTYIVYMGTGRNRTVTVSGLNPMNRYSVHVLEYNYAGADIRVKTAVETMNPRNFTTTINVLPPTNLWVENPTPLNGDPLRDVKWKLASGHVDGTTEWDIRVRRGANGWLSTYGGENGVDIGTLATVDGDGNKNYLLDLFGQPASTIDNVSTYYTVEVRARVNGNPSATWAVGTVFPLGDVTPPKFATATKVTGANTMEVTVIFDEDVTKNANGVVSEANALTATQFGVYDAYKYTNAAKTTTSPVATITVAGVVRNTAKSYTLRLQFGEEITNAFDTDNTDFRFRIGAASNLSIYDASSNAMTPIGPESTSPYYIADQKTVELSPNVATVKNDTYNPKRFYCTIQQAVNDAADADVIVLKNATGYSDNIDFTTATSTNATANSAKGLTINDGTEGTNATDAIVSGKIVFGTTAAKTTTLKDITFKATSGAAITVGTAPSAGNDGVGLFAGSILVISKSTFDLSESAIGITNNATKLGLAGTINIGTANATTSNNFKLDGTSTGIKIVTENSHANTNGTLSIYNNEFTLAGTAIEFTRSTAGAFTNFETTDKVWIGGNGTVANTGNKFNNTGLAIKMTQSGTNYLATTLPKNINLGITAGANVYKINGAAGTSANSGFTSGFYHDGTNSPKTGVSPNFTYKTDAFATATILAAGPVLYSANSIAEIGDVPYGTIDAAYAAFEAKDPAVDGNILLMNNTTYTTTNLDIDHSKSLSIIGKDDANEDPAKKAIINSKWNVGSIAATEYAFNNLIFKAATALEIDASFAGSTITVSKCTFDGNSVMPIDITAKEISGVIKIGLIGAGNGNTFTGTLGGAVRMPDNQFKAAATSQILIVNNIIPVAANKYGIYVSTTNSTGANTDDAKLVISENKFSGAGDAVVFEDAVNSGNKLSVLVGDISLTKNEFKQTGYGIKILEKVFTGADVTDNTGFVGATLPTLVLGTTGATNENTEFTFADIYGAAWVTDLTTNGKLYPSLEEAFKVANGANVDRFIGVGEYLEDVVISNTNAISVTAYGGANGLCKLGANNKVSLTALTQLNMLAVPETNPDKKVIFQIPTVELKNGSSIAQGQHIVKDAGTLLIPFGNLISLPADNTNITKALTITGSIAETPALGGTFDQSLTIKANNVTVSYLNFSVNDNAILLTEDYTDSDALQNVTIKNNKFVVTGDASETIKTTTAKTYTNLQIKDNDIRVSGAGSIGVELVAGGVYPSTAITGNKFTAVGNNTKQSAISLGRANYTGTVSIATNEFILDNGSADSKAGADYGILAEASSATNNTATLAISNNTFTKAAASVVGNKQIRAIGIVNNTAHASNKNFSKISVTDNKFESNGYSIYSEVENNSCVNLPATIDISGSTFGHATEEAKNKLTDLHYRGFLYSSDITRGVAVAAGKSLTFNCVATAPTAFTTGTVAADGTAGTTVNRTNFYNSTNNVINVTVPVEDRADITGGQIQIQVSNNGDVDGSYVSVANSGYRIIALNDLGKSITLTLTAADINNAIANAVVNANTLYFRAVVTSFNGGVTKGAASANVIVVDRVAPIATFTSTSAGNVVNLAAVQSGFVVTGQSDEANSRLYIVKSNVSPAPTAATIANSAIEFSVANKYINAPAANTPYIFNVTGSNNLPGNVTPFVHSMTAGSEFTYKVYAQDAAGNISAASGTGFSVDAVKPLKLAEPTEGVTNFVMNTKTTEYTADGFLNDAEALNAAPASGAANAFSVKVSLAGTPREGERAIIAGDFIYLYINDEEVASNIVTAAQITANEVLFSIATNDATKQLTTDGLKNVKARAKSVANAYGDYSPIFDFTVDRTAPANGLATILAAGSNNGTIVAKYYNLSNNGATVKVNIPNAAQEPQIKDGKVQLFAKMSAAGSESDVLANKVGSDFNTEVVITPEMISNGFFEFNVADNNTSTNKGLKNLTGWATQGKHIQFASRIVDKAGNAVKGDYNVTTILNVDLVKPADNTDITATAVGGNVVAGKLNKTNTAMTATLTLLNDPSLDGGTLLIQYSTDNGTSWNNLDVAKAANKNAVNTVTGNIDVNALADATEIKFRAIITDAAGNASDATATATKLTVDKGAPTATLVSATADNVINKAERTAGFNIIVKSTKPGIIYVVNHTDNPVVTATNIAGKATYNIAAAAGHTEYTIAAGGNTATDTKVYRVYAVDAAGNLSDAAEATFTVVATKPAIASISVPTAMKATTHPIGTAIPLAVTFNRPVTLTATNTALAFDASLQTNVVPNGAAVNSDKAVVNYAIGATATASETLTLTYTLLEKHSINADGSLVYSGDVILNNAKLVDVYGNEAELTTPAVGTWATDNAIKIDGVRPTIDGGIQYYTDAAWAPANKAPVVAPATNPTIGKGTHYIGFKASEELHATNVPTLGITAQSALNAVTNGAAALRTTDIADKLNYTYTRTIGYAQKDDGTVIEVITVNLTDKAGNTNTITFNAANTNNTKNAKVDAKRATPTITFSPSTAIDGVNWIKGQVNVDINYGKQVNNITGPVVSLTNATPVSFSTVNAAAGQYRLVIAPAPPANTNPETYPVTVTMPEGSAFNELKDNYNNYVLGYVATAHFDVTAPQTSLSAIPANWLNAAYTLAFNPTDLGSGVKEITGTINNTTTGATTAFTVANTPWTLEVGAVLDGNYTVTYSAKDKLDNGAGTSATTGNIKIDKTAPVIATVGTPANAASVNAGVKAITWTAATDFLPAPNGTLPGSGVKAASVNVEYTLNATVQNPIWLPIASNLAATATTCDWNIPNNIATVGNTAKIRVSAEDNAGNIGRTESALFSIVNETPGVAATEVVSKAGASTQTIPNNYNVNATTTAIEVEVTFDRAMNTAVNPTFTLGNGLTTRLTESAAGWNGNTKYKTTYLVSNLVNALNPANTLLNGSYTITVAGATDPATNVVPSFDVTINADQVIPTAVSHSIAKTSGTATANVVTTGNELTVSFEASEAVSTPTVAIKDTAATVTGAAAVWTGKTTINAETVGIVNYTINYSDLAGNAGVAVAQNSTISVDKTAPTLTVVTGQPIYTNGSQTIKFTVNDANAVNEAKIGAGAYAAIVSEATTIASINGFDALVAGAATVNVKTTDLAGNFGEVNVNIVKDMTAPVVTILTPDANSVVKGTSVFTYSSESGASVNAAEVKIASSTQDFAPLASGAAFSAIAGWANLADGNFTLQVRQTDKAGNTTTSSRQFNKDVTAPTIESVVWDCNNLTATVTFSEPVYTATNVNLNASSLTYNTNVNINTIALFHTLGQSTATIQLILNPGAATPTNANTFSVSALANTIYDAAGNAMVANTKTSTFRTTPVAPTRLQATIVLTTNTPTIDMISGTVSGNNIKWYSAANGGVEVNTLTVGSTVTLFASQTVDRCESAINSNGVAVTVNAPCANVTSVAVTPAGPVSVFACETLPLLTATANANAQAPISYVWYKNNVVIEGASAATYQPTTAGTYKVVASNTCSSNATSNEVTVNINALTAPTVTSNATYVYNNTARTVTATTPVAGAELVWYDASNVVLAAAPSLTNAGTVTGFVATKLGTCESAKAPFTLTITKANLTIAAANGTKVYGTVFTPAFTTTGLIGTNTVTNVTFTSTGIAATAAVGSYPIAPSAAVGTGLDNYNITYTPATLTVTPKALTITANNQTKVAGNAFAFLGTEFVATGLVNADAVNTVTLTSAGSAAAAIAGTYSIVPSAAVGTGLANYTIAYANGTFTVNDAPPAPADRFVFENIATQVSGTQFTVTVTSKNEFGAIAPVASATDIIISYGSTTATATIASGASTASANFTLDIPTGLTGVTLSGAGLGTATSNAFTVLAAAPAEPISITRGLRNREWINLTWNGNGEDVMLVGIAGNTMPALTLDGIGAIPAANANFRDNKTELLQGVHVLYMGSDVNGIQVTGLDRNLPAGNGVYTFAIYTYNGTTNTWNFSSTRKELYTNTLSKELNETETSNDFVAESFSVSSVAPNPVKDQVNFQVNALTDANFTIELFNANGETVLSQTQFFNAGSHSLSLDLFTQKGMIAAGSYFLRVTSEGETLTQPVVVMP